MSYIALIDRFIHPFIIYVLAGTLISYILVSIATKMPLFKDSKARALLYMLPFAVPVAAYIWFRPYISYNCILFKRPMGIINNWLCTGAKGVAAVLTPLFFFVTIFAVTKAVVSIFAIRRITKKYGFATPEDYPALFEITNRLCLKGDIEEPRIIVTRDYFARSFTMGKRFPVIVLSEGLLGALDHEELETVIAHELGHIKRSDSMLNWLTVFVRDVMFFSPFVYLSFKKLAAEKEMATDDFAISLTGKPYAFAEALIKVWRLSPRKLLNNLAFDNFMPYPNFVSGSGILELRVKRIVNNENTAGYSAFAVPVIIILGITALYLVNLFC